MVNVHALLRTGALAGFRSRLLINVLRLIIRMGGARVASVDFRRLSNFPVYG